MSEKYSFVKTIEDLTALNDNLKVITSRGVETLTLFWETDIDVLAKLIPPPLKLATNLVCAYICHIPYISVGKGYSEGGLLVPVTYGNQAFSYFLDLVVSPIYEMPMLVGREINGFPKKMAEKIILQRNGDKIEASLSRNGINFFSVKAEIGSFNIPEADVILSDALKTGETPISSTIVITSDVEYHCNKLLFNNIRLVENPKKAIIYSAEKAKITNLTFTPSIDNPWDELVVKKLLGATYSIENESFQYASSIVERLSGYDYYKYLIGRWDSANMGHLYREYK